LYYLVSKPEGLVLDKTTGYFYYADSGLNKIIKISENSADNRTTLFNLGKDTPKALAFDTKSRYVYNKCLATMMK
jgi:DNA-binding beta-propeller fold protein YncE